MSGDEPETSDDDVIELANRQTRQSYYQILGLPHRYASSEEVKRAFHLFASRFHPDLFVESNEAARLASKEAFKRAVEAYETLRDAAMQRHYVEQFLKKGLKRLPSGEFGRRFREMAVAAAPPPPPAPKPPPRPSIPDSWVDTMKTDDGREIAARIERMISEGRYQPALQQLSLLASVERDNPAVASREALVRRRLGR